MSVASSGARGLKAKFESMAEEKRKREEEEKAQQMARQQQERKALVKMSHEAQQPVATREEPAAPAPLPKKISSEVSTQPSGIHIQHSLPGQEPRGSVSLVKGKTQNSPVLAKSPSVILVFGRFKSNCVIELHIYI